MKADRPPEVEDVKSLVPFLLMFWRSASALFLLAGMFSLTGGAMAQSVPGPLPGTVEPGRRDEPLPNLKRPGIDIGRILRIPQAAAPPGSEDQTLVVTDIRIEGVTAYRPADLRPLYEPLLNKEITVRELYGIAGAIQARYQEDGYILSFALVPPQTVEDGVFTITVIEGYVDKVIVEGIEGRLAATVQRAVDPIGRSRPLHLDDLERYLLLVNDLAGIKATGLLRPSQGVRGAAELVVKSVHNPVGGSLQLDNRGSKFAGPLLGSAEIVLNSLLGLGESLSARVTTSKPTRELRSLAVNYIQPVGHEGLRLELGFYYAVTEPGFTLKQFNVETESVRAELRVIYPIIRTRDESLYLETGLSVVEADVKILNQGFSKDRLRTLFGGFTYLRNDVFGGRSIGRFRVVKGVPVFGASDADNNNTSRGDQEPDYTKFTLDVTHLQPLFDRFELTIAGRGQIALQPLPASEEFALGGPRFGRAYDPGEITGEDGFALSFELGYDVPLTDYLNSDFVEFVRSVRPYVFYDVGKAWDDKTSASIGLVQSLSSAGAGVRTLLARGVNLSVEYALPLTFTPNAEGDKNGRFLVFFGVTF